MAHEQEGELRLPSAVVGSIDVNRLSRELEAFEDFARQASVRVGGQKSVPPRTSRLLDELVGLNQLNLLQGADRQRLAAFLQELGEAPSVHISFAADPSAAFTVKIVAWLRANIHPRLLVQVGLQPNIAAGCVLRTPNHVFDFSLRQNFINQRGMLAEAIANGGPSQ